MSLSIPRAHATKPRALSTLLVVVGVASSLPLLGTTDRAHAADEAASSPVAVVKALNDALLATLKDATKLGFKGRVEKLTPVVDQAYDVSFMAEKSLGSGWNALSEADRKRWIELSRQFSVSNYAANFDHDAGQKIEILGEEPGAADTTIVKTAIVETSGDSVAMSYRLRHTDAGWKIIDVYLKGTVSELALRRSDYSSVLQREGFPALAQIMETRIADLAAGRGKQQGGA